MSKKLVKEVSASKFIGKCSKEFQSMKEFSMPEWARFAKTGSHKKFPPLQSNWWYTRAASVFRRITLDGSIGVSRLRTYYGGRKERGHKPEKTVKASGNVIRKILQQLESAGLVEKNKTGGRVISLRGREFLNKIVGEIRNE